MQQKRAERRGKGEHGREKRGGRGGRKKKKRKGAARGPSKDSRENGEGEAALLNLFKAGGGKKKGERR